MFQSTSNQTLELLQSPDADIYLQGAQLTRFRDWLFLSAHSNFAAGRAMRGGVPVIFPWFGPNKNNRDLPQHGWARTTNWQIENVAVDAVTLQLEREGWNLKMKFGFGNDLRLRFEAENTGETTEQFECALHTYFAVDDVANVHIEGLDGITYLDKTDDYRRKTQVGEVTLSGETDRIYLDAGGPIRLQDGARTLLISGEMGWRSSVVWNPGRELGAKMKDVGAEEWMRFVCVECGAIADDAVSLAAGESYVLDVSIEVENRAGGALS